MEGESCKKFKLPLKYTEIENIWDEYKVLMKEYNPINLGYGFPNFLPPDYVLEALKETATSTENSLHQYSRGAGHPRLVRALGALYSKVLQRTIDPYGEICVSVGASHAMFLAVMSTVDLGDEVIIIEPFFPSYAQIVKSAGGVPKYIALEPKNENSTSSSDWIFDSDELKNLFNEKTKAIILNTPHNPLGKVFTLEELTLISELCKQWDVVCISDEVYEWLVYDNNKHIQPASLPGMWERSLTIGSAGKIFGTTGWKLGWIFGPPDLMKNLQTVHHNSVRSGNTFLQEAAAICFEKHLQKFGTEDCYFLALRNQLEIKRNFVVDFLNRAGFSAIVPEGGYFVVANWSLLEKSVDLGEETGEYKDSKLIKLLMKEAGVQGTPVTPQYSQSHQKLGEKLVRFCFVKTEDYLQKAADNLIDWKKNL